MVVIKPLHDLILGDSAGGKAQAFFAADGRLYVETSVCRELSQCPETVLDELEPYSARVVRRVCSYGYRPPFPLSLSPDGRFAVTILSQGELAAIDLSSGKIIQRAARLDGAVGLIGTEYHGPCWRHVAGWFDSESACVQWFDSSANRHEVYRWNIFTGKALRLADVPIPKTLRADAGPAIRLLYLIPGSNPPLVFEVPDKYSEVPCYGVPSSILVRRLNDGGSVEREIKNHFWGGVAPVSLADGSAFFIRGWGNREIMLCNMADGSLIGELESPGFMGTLQDGPAGLAYHDPTRRLFVATANPGAVHVRDTLAKVWMARLSFDLGLLKLPDDRISVSPDGRWVAISVTAVHENAANGVNKFVNHLLIFDLSTLNQSPAPKE